MEAEGEKKEPLLHGEGQGGLAWWGPWGRKSWTRLSG